MSSIRPLTPSLSSRSMPSPQHTPSPPVTQDSLESRESFVLTGCCIIDLLLRPFYCLLVKIGLISPKEKPPKSDSPPPLAPPIIPPLSGLNEEPVLTSNRSLDPEHTSTEFPPNSRLSTPQFIHKAGSNINVTGISTPQTPLSSTPPTSLLSNSKSKLEISKSAYGHNIRNSCYNLSTDTLNVLNLYKVDSDELNCAQLYVIYGCSVKNKIRPFCREKYVSNAITMLEKLCMNGADLNFAPSPLCEVTISGTQLPNEPGLIAAIRHDLPELVKFYIDNAADLSCLNKYFYEDNGKKLSWLKVALMRKNDNLSALLIKSGIDLRFTIEGLTPLQYTSFNGFENSLRALLERKVNTEQIGDLNDPLANAHIIQKPPLEILEGKFEESKNEKSRHMLDIFVLYLIKTNAKSSSILRGSSPFHYACYYALTNTFNYLLKDELINEGGTVNLPNHPDCLYEKRTPLFIIDKRSKVFEDFPDISGSFMNIAKILKKKNAVISLRSPPPERR